LSERPLFDSWLLKAQ